MSNTDNSDTTTTSVLVVDDDPDARRWLCHYLGGCAFLHPPLHVRVFEAASGKDAEETVRNQAINFVFLDYFMPDVTGLDCLNKLLEADPDLPVTLLTGVDSTSLAADAIKRGACDYTVKTNASLQEIHRSLWKGLEWAAMRRRIRSQAAQLVNAEQQRVMIESLAAACHHLGQPATVIESCLGLLKHEALSPQMQDLIKEAQLAADRMSDILRRMQELQDYRTEPYLPAGIGSTVGIRMLVI